MHYTIKNNTNKNMSTLHKMVNAYFPYAKKEMGFDVPVTIVFESDQENAKRPLGKTAYYDPSNYKVVLYTDNRHPKDVMRSLSHELVHHKQNCNGELEGITGEQGYAQTEHGHRIEEEAYSLGNTCFRNWEDSVKKRINETTYSKRGKTMSEETIRDAVRKVINESQTLKKYFNDKVQLKEEGEIWSPSHYCVHHGGVSHNGKIEMAEAVQHNYDKELKRVTHYDMKLPDGTILENVPFEEIQVTEASLAEGHGGHAMKRDDKKDKKKKKKKVQEEGVVEEAPEGCEDILRQVEDLQWEMQKEPMHGQEYNQMIISLREKHPDCFGKEKVSMQSKFGGLGEDKEGEVLEEATYCEGECAHYEDKQSAGYERCINNCIERQRKPYEWDEGDLSRHESQKSEKAPIKEWYGNSLYEKLLKEYTGGKK